MVTLDSVLRQINAFEDIIIMNFSKILIKFAIVFKILYLNVFVLF